MGKCRRAEREVTTAIAACCGRKADRVKTMERGLMKPTEPKRAIGGFPGGKRISSNLLLGRSWRKRGERVASSRGQGETMASSVFGKRRSSVADVPSLREKTLKRKEKGERSMDLKPHEVLKGWGLRILQRYCSKCQGGC